MTADDLDGRIHCRHREDVEPVIVSQYEFSFDGETWFLPREMYEILGSERYGLGRRDQILVLDRAQRSVPWKGLSNANVS